VPKKLTRYLPLAIAILGIALILYPYVSDWYYKGKLSSEVESYDATVEKQDDSEIEAEMEEAQAYNERLADSYVVVTDPFDPDASIVTYDEYQNLLNVDGSGMMATLYIPKIDVALPIFHGTESVVLQSGVGHMATTSLPVGGPSTHAVLAGHNGLPSIRIFDDLDQLEPGDYFIIRVLGEDHAYRVTSKETVLPDETSSLFIQDGKDLCTLVTCVPYGINTHRLLVHAERCEVPQEWLDQGSDDVIAASQEASRRPLIIFTMVGLAIALLLFLLSRRGSKQEEKAESEAGGEPKDAPEEQQEEPRHLDKRRSLFGRRDRRR
jgi:sortase A